MTAAARACLIAGTHSGVGKTSLSLGIMGALRRRGHQVAPFKVGPDYIDPTYHTSVCGVPSRNLDTWLMPSEEMVGVFRRGVARGMADGPAAGLPTVAVVEGVMGLFDGLSGADDRSSTAQIAKLLDLPVILVVDSSSMARSAAAVVLGYRTFDPQVRVAGVIFNKVGGPSHEAALREALGDSLPLVGVVPRRPDLHLASRHLGLIPTLEDHENVDVLDAIVAHVEEHVDLDLLLSLGRQVPRAEAADGGLGVVEPSEASAHRRRVAVARDAAFSFYYQDNLDVLEEEGAEVVEFRPVDGDRLPLCDALYLGGGYPEVYAAELGANVGLRDDLRSAAADGLPLYAECGGYLYLGQEIAGEQGTFPMAGVLPTRASMVGKRLRLGYVSAEAEPAHPLAGERFQGHLFHYSSTTGASAPAYRVSRRGETIEDGQISSQVVASYVHLHFRGSRAIARWLARGQG